ncbi:uncharacterized protein [Ptychodera flava]|uniref:uncharacterized protein isoform X2 n=1 Tax=Ptychodera flava TaxID=63121 RepID=UPI00396A0FC9
MDPNKTKSLVNWVNCVCGNVVENITQLWDGVVLMNILQLINEDFRKEDIADDPKEKIGQVLEYLQGCYPEQNIQVAWPRIIFDRDETEIGKLITLLLIQAVQCSNREFFVNEIIKNDKTTQFHIMKIIEFICEGDESVLRPDYAHILSAASFELGSCNSSLNESSGSSSSFISTTVPAVSPVMRIFTNSPAHESSPVKMFLNSPQMKSRLMQRKMKEDMKKLERSLSNETHIREEREQEIVEKNKIIMEMETKLSDLRQQLQELKPLRYEVYDLKNANVLREKAEAENSRLKMRIEELSHYKSDNIRMEENLRLLSDEKYSLEHSLKDQQKLVAELDTYKTKWHKASFEMGQMEMRQKFLQQQCEGIKEEKEQLKSMFAEREQSFQQKISNLEEEICKQANEEPKGESLGIIMQQQMTELERENENLKATMEKVSAIHHTKVTSLESELQKARVDMGMQLAEISRLSSTLQDTKRESDRIVTMQTAELENLRASLKNVETDRTQVAKEKSLLQQEVCQLQNSLSEMAKDAQMKSSVIESLNKSLEVMKEEREKQRTRLTEDIEKLKAKVMSEGQARETVSSEKNVVQSECTALQQKIPLMEKECEEYRLSLEMHKQDVTEKSRKVNILEKQLQEQQEFFKGTIEKLHQEMQALKGESQNREYQLQEKVHNLQGTQQQLEMAKENESWAQKEKIKALKEEVLALQRRNGQLEEKMRSDMTANNERFRSIEEEHEKALAEKSTALEEIREKAKALESRYETEKGEYQREVDRLNTQLGEISTERDGSKSDMEQVKAELCSKVEQLEKEHAVALAEIENQRAEIANKTLENTKIRDEATKKIMEMKNMCATKVGEMGEKAGVVSGQIQSLKKTLDETMKEKDKKHAELLKVRNEFKNFSRMKEEMEKKLKDSETRGDQYKLKLQKLVPQVQMWKAACEKEKTKLAEYSEEKKMLSSENSKLKTEVQNLQTECNSLKKKDAEYRQDVRAANQKVLEEKKHNTSLTQRVRSLEVQLDFANKQIRETQKKGEVTKTSPDTARISPHTVNTSQEEIPLGLACDESSRVDNKWGFHDTTLNLSDLEMNSTNRSGFGSPDSILGFDGNLSNRSKGASTIFEITMTSKKSLNISDASSFLEFGNTIPELAASTSSIGTQPASKQTTGRAGFVFMSGCEDEPEHFDWGRVSELQRRNTLCLPHMRSAYAIETQYATPGKAEEKNLKDNVDPSRKRKAGTAAGDENTHSPRKLRSLAGQRRRATLMECPAPSVASPHNVQQKQTSQSKKGPVAFSIGFTPQKEKQKIRASSRLKKAAQMLKDKGKKSHSSNKNKKEN